MNNEDNVYLGKFTVALEAEGESFQGKLGVAFVLVNRMERAHKSLAEICFAPNQFECWGSNDQKVRLGRITDTVLIQCERVMRMALGHDIPDPTNGSTYYMNEELVIQRAGRTPGWWDRVVKTVKIDRHQFAKDQ